MEAPDPETEAPRNETVHSVLVASSAQPPEVGAGVVVPTEGVVVGLGVVVGAAVVGVVVVGAAVVGAAVVETGCGVVWGVLLQELPHSTTCLLVAFTNVFPVEVMSAAEKLVPHGPQIPAVFPTKELGTVT